MRIAVFCEAPSDFETTRILVGRVLAEEGPMWARELQEHRDDAVVSWTAAPGGDAFFDIHRLGRYAAAVPNARRPQGRFSGEKGAAGAVMARTAFWLLRQLAPRDGAVADVAVLVWDMDQDGDARRTGLGQARDEARAWASFRIVLGCPDAMREAWVLAGFDPEDQREHAAVATLRAELGFSPTDESHELTAADETAKRSAKRVLRALSQDDRDREARCLTATPLSELERRGGSNGLASFLAEVRAHVLPLVGR